MKISIFENCSFQIPRSLLILAWSSLAPTLSLLNGAKQLKKGAYHARQFNQSLPTFIQMLIADVLIRKSLLSTAGTRYPHKDQLVITAENTYKHPTNPLYTYSQRIDVVVKCEKPYRSGKAQSSVT